jgi:hypothetical protein
VTDLTLLPLEHPSEVRTFEKVMRAGEFFHVPPGHDSWVVGSETYAASQPPE